MRRGRCPRIFTLSFFLISLPGQSVASLSPVFFQAPAAVAEEKIDLQTIIEKMAAHKRLRDQVIQTFAVDRVYKVENKRVNKQATVETSMFFVAPEEKLFEVHSYSGSGFMRKGVLNRLIETERQSAKGDLPVKTAISSDNYEFLYLRKETVRDRPHYVLRAKPRQKDGLLFDGTIWVDAADFAVTRIEARPAKNPSFWTRKIEFVQEYEKIDGFWFPVRNSSVSSVFLFGRTTTEIQHRNYRINQPGLLEQASELRKRGTKLEIQIDSRDKK